MKKLVVYYSFEGNTKFIAEAIAEEIKADLLELKPKKPIKTHSFLKYIIGGWQVVTRKKPKLEPFDKNPQDYDILFIGSPTWSFTFTPPIRTFLSTEKLTGKKIGLFCCRMTMKGRTFKSMKKALKGNEILGEIDFSQPLIKDKDKDSIRVKEWAKKVVSKLS